MLQPQMCIGIYAQDVWAVVCLNLRWWDMLIKELLLPRIASLTVAGSMTTLTAHTAASTVGSCWASRGGPTSSMLCSVNSETRSWIMQVKFAFVHSVIFLPSPNDARFWLDCTRICSEQSRIWCVRHALVQSNQVMVPFGLGWHITACTKCKLEKVRMTST